MARWLNRKSLRILMYHRFGDPVALAEQCAHIRAYYEPVSMAKVAAWLEGGDALPQNALAVTVDDGYRDFYRVAYPVFREFGIPATVYLVSDFVDRRLWLWVDQVRYCYRNGRAKLAELETEEDRNAAAFKLIESLKRVPNSERQRTLAKLPKQLEVTLPQQAPQQYEPLRWDEVREMAATGTGIEFGAHTRTHPVLSRVKKADDLAEEIAGSKRRIEQQLDRTVNHFCYPNGSNEDFTDAAVQAVRGAGFRTSVTTEKGLIHSGVDPLRLPRIGVQPELDSDYFERCAAGFRV